MNDADSFARILAEAGTRCPGRLPEKLRMEPGTEKTLRVVKETDTWVIRAGTPAGFARGIGFAMAETETEEITPFRTMGVMIDCSRNRVPTLEYLKTYFVRLALMGYNLALLYTEDTYELPEEPRFGYMRGAYSIQEIKELDAFARGIGIELVACIQTLGHLSQILRWNAYERVRDTSNVLLVDEPETYRLIGKMIAFWKEALSATRIHIGMDETHDLGRGNYLDRNGYENGFDLFNRHLEKVAGICRENGLEPILWSDMYFRLGSTTRDYYDMDAVIPDSVRQKIPSGVRLCYWDYYHRTPDFYETYILKHRELGNEPILASGVWTWYHFWYDHEWTRATVVPCIEACRRTGLEEIFFTMWGDNGGYCIPESSLAGVEFAAGVVWGESPDAAKPYGKRLAAICGKEYSLFLRLSQIGKHYWNEWPDMILQENILWDDPLYGMACNAYAARSAEAVADYRSVLKTLDLQMESEPARSDSEIETAASLIRVLSLKFDFHEALSAAYSRRDGTALRQIAEQRIPEFIDALERFDLCYRENWLKNSKPFGLEVIQRRNAGVRTRLEETKRRISEYLDGTISRIEELDAALRGAGSFDASFRQFYSGCFNP